MGHPSGNSCDPRSALFFIGHFSALSLTSVETFCGNNAFILTGVEEPTLTRWREKEMLDVFGPGPAVNWNIGCEMCGFIHGSPQRRALHPRTNREHSGRRVNH